MKFAMKLFCRSRRNWLASAAFLAVAGTMLWMSPQAVGMGFTMSMPTTIAQDIHGSTVTIIAKLVALPVSPDANASDSNPSEPIAKFEIEDLIKGKATIKGSKTVAAPFYDDSPVGGEYLVLGAKSPDDKTGNIVWTSPYALTPRSRKYVSEIVKLPPSGTKRLAYFQDYFEDKENLLRNDSFCEFEVAPFATIREMKALLPHYRLVRWATDPAVANSHRRLYLKMLGVCGGPADLPMLETLLKSKDPKPKTCLDATVICYLVLRHADSLPRIEELFLKKKPKEFTDVFSVVMALRFLDRQANGVISRDRLVATMRLVLDEPRLADQAIPDLARWDDWSDLDRIMSLFKNSKRETALWVRISAINYLRACPLPKKSAAIHRGMSQDRSESRASVGDVVFHQAETAMKRPKKRCQEPISRNEGQRDCVEWEIGS